MKPGHDYVLFLWTSRSGLTQVMGLSQGLFKLSEEGSGEAVAQRAAASELMLNPSGLPVADRAVNVPLHDLRSRVRKRIIERKRRVRRALVFAVALVVVAFGIAMAVPDARSSILRFFHIGSATVERVHTLPPARERPLAAGLGPTLSRRDAEARSGIPLVLSGVTPTRYYAQPGLTATLLEYRGKPVLLAEMGGDQVGITKKFVAPETRVEPAEIGSEPRHFLHQPRT